MVEGGLVPAHVLDGVNMLVHKLTSPLNKIRTSAVARARVTTSSIWRNMLRGCLKTGERLVSRRSFD